MAVKRKIDIVFCIDGTVSMGPFLEEVKANAKVLYQQLSETLLAAQNEIEALRLKVITFRDYETEGADNLAMVESDFFEMPTDVAMFDDHLAGTGLIGGGDIPENGLEALYLAMKSDFVATGPKDRQIIILFTDADALPLQERAGCPGYPTDMLKSIDELAACWMGDQTMPTSLGAKTKRLVVFAPKGTIYDSYISNYFDQTVFQAVNPADGLAGVEFDTIIKLLAASAK